MATSRPARLLDQARFPRAAEYLSTLPAGLESYPDCLARVTIAEPHARDHGAIAGEKLPAPLRSLFGGTLDPDAWIPEVLFQTANLMLRDVRFASDADFHRWTYDVSRELFDKPVLRTFMRLMSPTLIVLGSAKRWSAFHRGSALSAGNVHSKGPYASVQSALAFPQALFPKLFLQGLERAFAAALVGARAKNPEVKLVEATLTAAKYDVTWQ